MMISLGTDKIDLVILNVASIELKYKIIAHGKKLISKDEIKRIDFEEKALLDYFDLKPYLDEYDNLLLERITQSKMIDKFSKQTCS